MDAQILGLVREVIYTLAAVGLPLLLKPLVDWLTAKAQDERWRGATEKLERLVADAVGEVEQTYVRPMKASDGQSRWTDEAKPEALQRAEAIVRRTLGERGYSDIIARLGATPEDVDARIRTLIESTIARRK